MRIGRQQLKGLSFHSTKEGFKVTEAEKADLRGAWLLASRVRAATVLGTGRDHGERVEVLPSGLREIRLVGRLVGMAPGRERELEDLYRRRARHARRVVEQIVFGRAGEPRSDVAGSAGRAAQNRQAGGGRQVAGSGAEAAGRRDHGSGGAGTRAASRS